MDKVVQALANFFERSAEHRTYAIHVQPERCRVEPECLPIAAVRPILSTRAQAGFDRISVDVRERADQPSEMSDFPIPGPILEEVGCAAVASIRPPAVVSVDLPEADREAAVRSLEHEMVMIRHHAPRED
jgi:hypothetical protein